MTRTIFPKSVTLGATTWDKDSGGPVSMDLEFSATAIMDATGDDQTFSFLGFCNFVNTVVLRLHDADAYSTLQIGQNGALNVVFSIPATSTPTQDAADINISLGTGYITSFHLTQSFGSTSEVIVNLVCQTATFSVPNS